MLRAVVMKIDVTGKSYLESMAVPAKMLSRKSDRLMASTEGSPDRRLPAGLRAKAIAFVIAVMMAGHVSHANADAYCAAVPSEVLVGADGMVDLLTPYRGWIGICNVRSAWKNIDPQLCVSWFAMASNAVIQRKTFGLYYDGLAQADCSMMDTYERSPPLGTPGSLDRKVPSPVYNSSFWVARANRVISTMLMPTMLLPDGVSRS